MQCNAPTFTVAWHPQKPLLAFACDDKVHRGIFFICGNHCIGAVFFGLCAFSLPIKANVFLNQSGTNQSPIIARVSHIFPRLATVSCFDCFPALCTSSTAACFTALGSTSTASSARHWSHVFHDLATFACLNVEFCSVHRMIYVCFDQSDLITLGLVKRQWSENRSVSFLGNHNSLTCLK